MKRGPKKITRKQLDVLAKKAGNITKDKDVITGYKDLIPVFMPFIKSGAKFQQCFDFLVSEGVVTPDQEGSVRNVYTERSSNYKREIIEKAKGCEA